MSYEGRVSKNTGYDFLSFGYLMEQIMKTVEEMQALISLVASNVRSVFKFNRIEYSFKDETYVIFFEWMGDQFTVFQDLSVSPKNGGNEQVHDLAALMQKWLLAAEEDKNNGVAKKEGVGDSEQSHQNRLDASHDSSRKTKGRKLMRTAEELIELVIEVFPLVDRKKIAGSKREPAGACVSFSLRGERYHLYEDLTVVAGRGEREGRKLLEVMMSVLFEKAEKLLEAERPKEPALKTAEELSELVTEVFPEAGGLVVLGDQHPKTGWVAFHLGGRNYRVSGDLSVESSGGEDSAALIKMLLVRGDKAKRGV